MIPPELRDEFADYAHELHVQGKGHRFIAEAITHRKGVKISHVTAGVLVKEGRERVREHWPTRSDMAVDLHQGYRYLLEKMWEEWAATQRMSVLDIAPDVMTAFKGLARLHGVDAPTRLAISDGREPVTVDPTTVVQVREVTDAQDELARLRVGAGEEDPTS